MPFEFVIEQFRVQSSGDVYESAGRYSLPENSVVTLEIRAKGRGPAGSAVTFHSHYSFYRGTGDAQDMGAGDIEKKALGSGSFYNINVAVDGDGFAIFVKAAVGETVDWLVDGIVEVLG